MAKQTRRALDASHAGCSGSKWRFTPEKRRLQAVRCQLSLVARRLLTTHFSSP